MTLIYGIWGASWVGVTLLLIAEYKRGMCEKWWCELAFYFGNMIAVVLNLILIIVSIANERGPGHFPVWMMIEWSIACITNSVLIFLFFKMK